MTAPRYRSEGLEVYVQDAASGKPAPGGGSVSGLVGALAAAMSEMAANFTVGKKKFAAVDEQVRDCLGKLEAARERLLERMQADVEAYSSVGAAYAMPRETDEEKKQRREAIQHALKAAAEVPLDVVRNCDQVAGISACLVEVANPNLITDVAVSAILAEAACASARVNVEINLKYIEDAELVARVSAEVEQISRRTRECRQKVSETVDRHLSRG